MFRPNIKRSLLQLIGYSPQHTNPIISCLLDQVNKFTPETDNWSAEHLIEEIKITKAFSLETLEDFINAPTGDPAVYPTDLNTITKENYLLDLASKSLKRKIQLIPYSEKEQDWAKSAINQNIEYKFGNEFDGEPLNLLCSRITGSGNFFMSIFPLNLKKIGEENSTDTIL